MTDSGEISLVIRAIYDNENEAVGLATEGSEAFDAGTDTRAQIEILAALSAKANLMAAEVIRAWSADEGRKQALIEHFAQLKEHMLNDMLKRLDESDGVAQGQPPAAS